MAYGLSLFTIGSALCATAPSLPLLIAGCALQGAAGALVIPGALSILTQLFPDPAGRAHVIGGWSSFSALSLILGPVLGGLLVDHAGWQAIFLVNLPIGVLTAALGAWSLTESAHPDHAALDPIGQCLSVVFLSTLTFALINAGHAGWRATDTVIPAIVSAVALLLFVWTEMRTTRPVLPIDLLRNAPFAVANIASFVLGFSGYTSLFLFSLFLQQGQGHTATEAGWRMAPVFAAMLIVSSQFGRLDRRFGTNQLMIAGYILLGVSMLAMTLFTPATPYADVALVFSLLGAALGLAVPATGAVAMASAPRERTGAASATMNALRQGGMTIGIALLGTVMSARAITTLGKTLSKNGVGDAARIAADAVRHHQMPAGLPLTAPAGRIVLNTAFTHGFAAAAAISGAAGLAAALILILATPDRSSFYRTVRKSSPYHDTAQE